MKNKDQILLENVYSSIASSGTEIFDVFEEYDDMGLGQSSEMAIDDAIANVKELINSLDEKHRRAAKRAILNLWGDKIKEWRMGE